MYQFTKSDGLRSKKFLQAKMAQFRCFGICSIESLPSWNFMSNWHFLRDFIWPKNDISCLLYNIDRYKLLGFELPLLTIYECRQTWSIV